MEKWALSRVNNLGNTITVKQAKKKIKINTPINYNLMQLVKMGECKNKNEKWVPIAISSNRKRSEEKGLLNFMRLWYIWQKEIIVGSMTYQYLSKNLKESLFFEKTC